MKKITLQVNGREMCFSEQELIAIVEKHLSSEATQQTTTAHKVAQKPTEDEWFEVKPQAIEQKLFEQKRDDTRQEKTRQIILEAFEEMKKNPEKYGRSFKTMMPKKTWLAKTCAKLKEMACILGDHNADWVEQGLEWAQRLANGESWEAVCNEDDTAKWYRLVIWKNGYNLLVGGSVNDDDNNCPAADVEGDDFYDGEDVNCTVPLVVAYE